MKFNLVAVAVVATSVLMGATDSQAAPIQIGEFVGTDSYDWSEIALTPAETTPGATEISALGASATVNFDHGSHFHACIQGTSCWGNFESGDRLLAAFAPSFYVDFATPVRAVGTQVQTNKFGNFTIEMQLFDALLNPIGGPLSASGLSGAKSDGSSPFLGAVSDSLAISRVLFTATTNGEYGIVINALQVNEEMVPNPEPATLLLLGTGLGLVAYRRLRVRRS